MVDTQVAELERSPQPMDTDGGLPALGQLKRFVALDKRKRRLEEELKSVKAELEDLRPAVLDYFRTSGTQKQTLDGVTVYLHRQLWAGREEGVDGTKAAAALTLADLGYLVEPKFNTQSLSAFFREQEQLRDDLVDPADLLPPVLRGIIKLSETFDVRTRKA